MPIEIIKELNSMKNLIDSVNPDNGITQQRIFDVIEEGNIKCGNNENMTYYSRRILILRVVNYLVEEICTRIFAVLSDRKDYVVLNNFKRTVYESLCVDMNLLDEIHRTDPEQFDKYQKAKHHSLMYQLDVLIGFFEQKTS